MSRSSAPHGLLIFAVVLGGCGVKLTAAGTAHGSAGSHAGGTTGTGGGGGLGGAGGMGGRGGSGGMAISARRSLVGTSGEGSGERRAGSATRASSNGVRSSS